MSISCDEMLAQLRTRAVPASLAGMERYGINTHNALGIDIYTLRRMAKGIGINHRLAQELWESGLHEARILGSFIADPLQADDALLERWVADFDSWDVVDQVMEYMAKTPLAYAKVFEWARRPEEFVKRAAFAMIAELAAHDKAASDEKLAAFFPVIVQAADDDRNFVKKAVNWALRNLGKRSARLNAQAIAATEEIRLRGTRPARWIAADALRELTSEKVKKKLHLSS